MLSRMSEPGLPMYTQDDINGAEGICTNAARPPKAASKKKGKEIPAKQEMQAS